MHDDAAAGAEVAVLRLGHRPGRDERMTTHVGLTARALGADRVWIPDNAGQSRDTVADITDRFGGPFEVDLTDSPKAIIRNWEGQVVHLTMYGERVQDVEGEIRERHRDGESVLVVVGSEKVSFDVYEEADWNVGVTNQPHSEVAGLAVFLDRLFEGDELESDWEDAEQRVVPMATGKRVVPAESEEDGGAGSVGDVDPESES
ncbi:tRNA (cytidine(56)-2'-O)-methyltransferase [Natrialba magadii ATCC 43099]|uniref:tRNA (cytidine(56)-2'-O)-methyltransferase n=1 Tax=Natrialba magadii (strain ATCC 43099 / DSM 3394 / CCM 3739 / CIP 104546 / IAM 13178 / JCM 8861 / NBRC 102185 / NCIMB 2190 / MS3) TaxID=547559 RepID=D3SRT8_NATMM|nr:tRNA (cytidine(56)-2'-O)-methyltransferase [Natrialba magadii]ADD06712.1 tRNA (cytidine(56)-2'-O)-methyltransferase [Natrialba magadii ATCC 43099]ELY32144.1 tRNA 2'-O-methylase [Natrialba magadii ATCC 43099]